ncbi:MAG: GNAT family N-acetyltransferase, partial [Candidatus Rokuibacteriota bacterium]
MKNFKIRRATASDRDVALIAPMFDLYRQFYGKPADPKLAETFVRDRLRANESVIFIAVAGDGDAEGALGFVQLYPS